MKYKNSQEWINAIKKIHPDLIYSKSVYINSYHKVNVICPTHGEFTVDPVSHMRGYRCCPGCRNDIKLTQKGFIGKVTDIHPDLDFSKSVFTNTRNDVKVICPIHGEFYKQPRFLLSDSVYNGCPTCRSLSGDTQPSTCDKLSLYTKDEHLGSMEGVFYMIKVTYIPQKISFLKIGITSYTTYQRYKRKEYKDFSFEIINEVFDTNLNCAIKESEYKQQNKNNRFFLPDYIKFPGRSECYQLDSVAQLKSNQIKFIRDSFIEKQDNICPICKKEINMPTLDHSHTKRNSGSGLCRGVLCNTCNRFLGVIENNIPRNKFRYSDISDILLNVIDYLNREHLPYIHPSESPKKPVLSKRCFNSLFKAYKEDKPKSKPLVYPKNKHLTKSLQKLFIKYNIKITYNK